jgi:uncharacterized protein YbaP (TraB family)
MNLFFKFLGLIFSSQLLFVQASSQQLDQTLLWKIEGNDIKEPSYLFGTIHLIPKEDYFLPKGLEKAFNKSRKVFFEIDIDQMNDPTSMMGVFDKIFMNNDTSLTDLVTKEEYEKLNSYFEKIGFPLTMFERMKPMFLSALAGVDGNPAALKDGSYKSYELELSEMAKIKNLETDGLETVEFQLSIFDSIPYAIQAKMLLESIASTEQNEDQMKQMYNNYKQQNLNALNQSISKEDQTLQPYLEMMLYNRNKNWIPKIKSEVAKGACFFAVGAGHLGGEQGVINLLRKEGYTVKPVMNE